MSSIEKYVRNASYDQWGLSYKQQVPWKCGNKKNVLANTIKVIYYSSIIVRMFHFHLVFLDPNTLHTQSDEI